MRGCDVAVVLKKEQDHTLWLTLCALFRMASPLAFCALFGPSCWHSVAGAAVPEMHHYLSPPEFLHFWILSGLCDSRLTSFLLQRMSISSCEGGTEGTPEPLCRQTGTCFILILSDLHHILIQLLTQGLQPFPGLEHIKRCSSYRKL